MSDVFGNWSLIELRTAMRRGEVSAVQAVSACLEKIAAENEELRTFISVAADEALREAEAADQARAKAVDSGAGALWGVPLAIKDLIDVRGMRTTAASRVLGDALAAGTDAECVRRFREGGAIVLGKTNLHEFAYGGSGAISSFGAARNPLDRTRVCGGSSSGSAAAVAAGMCFGALGTDTAGSIRLPAACCGVVGFKPTFGTVPVAGVIPLAFSYDHVGPSISVKDWRRRSRQDLNALWRRHARWVGACATWRSRSARIARRAMRRVGLSTRSGWENAACYTTRAHCPGS